MNRIAVEGDVCTEKRFVCQWDKRPRSVSKRWVAALVHTNCEKKVASKLDKLGIENYVAIQTEEHQWSDRKKKIARVVIPMIIFVRLTKDEVDEFRRLPFIIKFVTYPGAKELATPIPDEQIEQLRYLLNKSESPVSFCSQVEVGDAIRIVDGPLKGLTGYCCGVGNSEVAIHFDMLGYATTYVPIVNIEKYHNLLIPNYSPIFMEH